MSIDEQYADKGKSLASNVAVSGVQTDDRHAAGLQRIVSAGQGQSMDAQQNLIQNASLNFNKAAHDADLSYRKSQERQSNFGAAAGTMAYAGKDYFKKPQANLSGNYQDAPINQYNNLNPNSGYQTA